MYKLKAISELKTSDDFDYIIQGGAFLGSGGGGPIAAGMQIKEDLLAHGQTIQLISPDVLTGDEAYGAVVAFMGSPSAGSHGIDLETPTNAFNALMALAPTKAFTYTMPIEIGAGNSLVPMTVAARLQIPVTDGEGAGRAVPKIQNTTFAQTTSPCPAALSNGKTADYPTIDNLINLKDLPMNQMSDALEAYCLKLMEIPEFGSMGGLATFMMQGDAASKTLIPGTLSLSYAIGQAICGALEEKQPLDQVLCAALDFMGITYYAFGKATVSDIIVPGTHGDLDLGRVILTDDQQHQMILSYENENLFATVDGNPWAMAPDLICYLNLETGAMSNVEIAKGDTVVVFGIPCQPQMRQADIVDSFMSELENLKVYSGPYIPIEQLHS